MMHMSPGLTLFFCDDLSQLRLPLQLAILQEQSILLDYSPQSHMNSAVYELLNESLNNAGVFSKRDSGL